MGRRAYGGRKILWMAVPTPFPLGRCIFLRVSPKPCTPRPGLRHSVRMPGLVYAFADGAPAYPCSTRLHTSLECKVGLGFRRAPPCVLACSKCPGGLCANGAPAYPCGARLHTFRGPQGWAGVPSRIRRPENSEEHCSDPVSLWKKPIPACLWDHKDEVSHPVYHVCGTRLRRCRPTPVNGISSRKIRVFAPTAPLLTLAAQVPYVPEEQGWAGAPSRPPLCVSV